MNLCDLAPPYIHAIAPYQPGKPISELERELGITNIIKLASNENPLGASPKALEAIKKAADEIALYPDGNAFELKTALAKNLNVELAQIIIGNGSNDVLELIARTFLIPQSQAIYSKYAFAVYPLVVQAMGAVGVEAPAKDFAHDVEAMLKAISAQTRIIFIANPNNPTGTLLKPAELEAFLKRIPIHIIIVLDEAYQEYLPESVKVDSVALLRKHPNLIITRTFSKVYGLAGLRVGYALAQPEMIALMNRVRQPFNVNSLAQVAAIAALGDKEFIKRSYELNQTGMQQLTKGFKNLDIEFIESYGNFISFKVPQAMQVFQALLRKGVIVRPLASYQMPDYLRVTIGTESENKRFLESLEQIIKS
jgi:histidinol-phosphate aminotransferase